MKQRRVYLDGGEDETTGTTLLPEDVIEAEAHGPSYDGEDDDRMEYM